MEQDRVFQKRHDLYDQLVFNKGAKTIQQGIRQGAKNSHKFLVGILNDTITLGKAIVVL